MTSETIVIERRYCGPPESANGGYIAGRLAAGINGAAEVTLHAPPPLDTPLTVVRHDAARELRDGATLYGSARPASLDFAWLAAPDLASAADAAGRTFPAALHRLPTCFVCGPLRSHGDGLRIHVGPLDPEDRDWQGRVAAPWVPAPDLADANGAVRTEFVWAALDCPTAYACCDAGGLRPILLGRQTVKIERRPRADEHCVVVALSTGRERRKHFADACLFGEGLEPLARCRAIWIELAGQDTAGAAVIPPRA